MTQELQETLDKEIDDAVESNDEGRIRRCTARYVKAIGDCQKKSSDRIKAIVASVNTIETNVVKLSTEIAPMKKSHEQFQEMMIEKRAMFKLLKWLKWIAAAVVGVIGWEGIHQIVDIMQKVSN